MTVRDLFGRLKWVDGRPLLAVIEAYRLRLFAQFFEERDAEGWPRFNLLLAGRGKKNWKSADLVLAGLFCLVNEPASGYDADVSLLANDKDQARDDLSLAKKLVHANPVLHRRLAVKRDIIERRDGLGFLEVLPSDAVGSHGKTRRLVGFDEIHGFRDWRLLEAMQPDPSRRDAQTWITSYASLYHRPGAPLFDLFIAGKAGTDLRMLFSWYAANFSTDPAFKDKSPEERANPSMASWRNPQYLVQQARRLPSHVYRRLHLNLPGLPEGSAYQPEPVMDAVDRGVSVRPPEPHARYVAFVDMSGGSRDDAVLAVGHKDRDGRAVLDRLVDQGARPPFDPRLAVERFANVLREYGVSSVVGDAYGGETFRRDFERAGIRYEVSLRNKSELYEGLEPRINSRAVVLLDVAKLEQQLLGLVWRGGRIDHQAGEHDDHANAVAGVVDRVLAAGADLSPEATARALRGAIVGRRAVSPWGDLGPSSPGGMPVVVPSDDDEMVTDGWAGTTVRRGVEVHRR